MTFGGHFLIKKGGKILAMTLYFANAATGESCFFIWLSNSEKTCQNLAMNIFDLKVDQEFTFKIENSNLALFANQNM